MELLTLDQINELLASKDGIYYMLSSGIMSNQAKELKPGDKILYGFYNGKKLYEATVVKIDGKGIIKTDAGVNFSTNYYEVCSTKKFLNREGILDFRENPREQYYHLYSFEFVTDKFLTVKKDIESRLHRNNHQKILNHIQSLDPYKDADKIDKILQFLETLKNEN